MEVTFLTSNPGKVAEVRRILEPYNVRVRSQRRMLPELQADDLAPVVRGKLAAIPPSRGWVLVEDSGLFVDSLGGFPGVYSSYVYRTWRFKPLLELLRTRGRSATFRTVAGVRHGREVWTFSGVCPGTIARKPRGSEGFGFDPIFVPRGASQTFSEMSPEDKGHISHRGRAMRRVGRFLSTRGRA